MWTAIAILAKKWWAGYLLTALVVVCAIAYLRYASPTPPAYNPHPQPVATANEPKVIVKKVIKQIQVPGPERIVYLPTPQVMDALPGAISPDVEKDNSALILAVAEIPPHSGKTIASAIMQTGKEGTARTRIDYKQMPRKFFEIKKEFGARGGIGTSGLLLAEIYARPIRLGPVEVEVRGWLQRDNLRGGDGGGAILLDYRF